MLDVYWWKHSVYGLLEVDVTVPHGFMADYKACTGESPSFTGYLAFCLAQAIDEDKSVQALPKGRRHLVVFDDVDVNLLIEHETGGTRVPMVHIIRRANHKTFLEIHREIRSIQAAPVPSDKGLAPWCRFFLRLPWPLSRMFSALMLAATRREPTLMAAMGGTVGVSAVGMFGRGIAGWGLTPLPHSLDLVVGTITRKPAIVAGQIEARDILNLTVVVDHDITDGAPATRFVRRLVELIESGHGLAQTDMTVDGLFSQQASRLAPVVSVAASHV